MAEQERETERGQGGPAGSGDSPRHHQEKVGIVTSAKMQKTIVVEVRRRVAHPVYKRIVTKRSKFMAHDEHGKAHEGDMVRIVESRPLSKNKRWSLKEVLRAATTGV
ncbi:MAG: 30S ribosomal protein S17 [Acidobacteria bacterium]|nr:30S ribosomal protein S17 [Acidobacteriota bacterium]